MKLVIIGTGYVGLVSGLGYAKLGHQIACVDVNSERIAKLDLGETPFYEPGLPELLKEMQEEGRIVFTTRLIDVLDGADIVVIAVGTPAGPYGQADLSSVKGVVTELGKNLNHAPLIVMKSTVPVGTNRSLIEYTRQTLAHHDRNEIATNLRIASCPEFLAEGTAIRDFMNPDRLVFGVEDDQDATLLDKLHEGLEAPRAIMSLESAELTKYAANAFLATKLSFINEIANIAEQTGANVRDVAAAIGMDPRIGPHFLRAGIGFGGSCFPKDVSALQQIAGREGYNFKVLSAVIEANNHQRERFFKRFEFVMGGLKGRKIAVWGLAFKGGTDDIRDSAAIDIVKRVYAAGADICAYDPLAMSNARKELSNEIELTSTAIDAAEGADALLVLAEWQEFCEVSFKTLKEKMLGDKIFDGKNLLSDLDFEQYGFDYYAVGQPKKNF